MVKRHNVDFDAGVRRLRDALVHQTGALGRDGRMAALEGRSDDPRLAAFLAKVTERAHAVTDHDVVALQDAGYSEDQIFEATVCAAVGAGLARLDRGLRALEGAEP